MLYVLTAITLVYSTIRNLILEYWIMQLFFAH